MTDTIDTNGADEMRIRVRQNLIGFGKHFVGKFPSRPYCNWPTHEIKAAVTFIVSEAESEREVEDAIRDKLGYKMDMKIEVLPDAPDTGGLTLKDGRTIKILMIDPSPQMEIIQM